MGASVAACFDETGKHAKGSAKSCARAIRAWLLEQRNALGLSCVCAEWIGRLFGQGRMRKPSARAPRMRATSRQAPRLWSAEVTRRSNALDLQPGVFTWTDPKRIAASLKRSAETSRRKKTDSYRSALSMLSFYINRAGANLSRARRRTLTRAKDELRRQFGRV